MNYNSYLSLGSNKGNRQDYLSRAETEIAMISSIVARSSIYETEAWGLKDQKEFLNQVIKIETDLKAEDLLLAVGKIENKLGKIYRYKWGPREIDIDILFYENMIIQTKYLQIPHPQIQNRKFILEPMAEIAGEFIHPVLKENISALLAKCADPLKVRSIK